MSQPDINSPINGSLLHLPEKAMTPHSSTLAWKIPWTEEPGGLQSMGSLGVGHDWATSLSLFTSMHWRRKWQPTPVFLPGESQGWGAWWAAVSGVPQSRTRLKRLSSSSSSKMWHNWTYLWNIHRFTDIQNKLVIEKGESRERNGLVFGISRCKLLYID